MGDAPSTPPPAHDEASAHRRPTADAQLDIIRTTARAFELDRYLTALLAPRNVRRDLIALAAFAGEIGRIPAFVSEPMMGEIRLQWWRDAVATMESGATVTGHPIADALAAAVTRHALPTYLVVAAIDAQSDRLRDVPFATPAAVLTNIDQSDGAHFALAWHVLNGGGDGGRQQRGQRAPPPPGLLAASRAYGLARLLLDMPILLASHRVLLPRDRLAAYGLTVDNLHLAEARPGLAAVVAEHASTVRANLSEARAAFSTGPRPLRMAMLPAALVRPYLRVSELTNDGPLAIHDLVPISRIARLWVAARWGVF